MREHILKYSMDLLPYAIIDFFTKQKWNAEKVI